MQKDLRGDPSRSQRNSHYAKQQADSKKLASRQNVLASLRATSIVASKPALPAELIAVILNYLPPADLIRCARVSRRMQEMVYDDTRWIQKLKAMRVWDDVEARSRHELGLQGRLDTQLTRAADQASRTGADPNGSVHGINGGGSGPHRERAGSTVLFDIGAEEKRNQRSHEISKSRPRRTTLTDGFDDLTVSTDGKSIGVRSSDMAGPLEVFRSAASARGQARKEYGRIYAALNPFYMDITKPSISTDPLVLRLYSVPEQQGQLLANLATFSLSDSTEGYEDRTHRLQEFSNQFEETILQEFRRGYDLRDVDKMCRYAQVSIILNGGTATFDTFISNNPMILGHQKLANPHDCVDGVAYGHVDLSPSHRFFERLASVFAEQTALIDQVFPPTIDVLLPLLERICDKVVQPFIAAVFNETRNKGGETSLKAMPGVFEQCMRFATSLRPTKGSRKDFSEVSRELLLSCFEPHVDIYLREESDHFRLKSEAEVNQWEKDLSEQEAKAESFFMSNVNRQAVKRDFLSSFKKVVMMPVNALPAFPLAANRQSTVPVSEIAPEKSSSRPNTPSLASSGFLARSTTPTVEAPTTELAAKTAIMNSRLEGIKSLFSIEVAINLIHLAKSAIERCAVLVRHKSHFGTKAKSQCEAIFVSLLNILGQRHIKSGFDRALSHLDTYNPREVKELRNKHPGTDSTPATGVEPLVTFCELVNVGDLIQQMVDVFYVQELVSTKLTDRDDFLNPAVKEKKRFEQMLDERVAAGLGKGIDVLMDEVEYICATTQPATDFNPEAVIGRGSGIVDIGVSNTANLVVETISGHTSMLVGSTEKHMLDVFNQEVGLRLFGVLCKHIKRQRISVDGAIKLISDINHYSAFIATLRQKPLVPYYAALRELAQIYLVDCSVSPPSSSGTKTKSNTSAKELATIIADTDRYKGIFPAEEVYEFAERRADWYFVKKDVERNMYGIGCAVM